MEVEQRSRPQKLQHLIKVLLAERKKRKNNSPDYKNEIMKDTLTQQYPTVYARENTTAYTPYTRIDINFFFLLTYDKLRCKDRIKPDAWCEGGQNKRGQIENRNVKADLPEEKSLAGENLYISLVKDIMLEMYGRIFLQSIQLDYPTIILLAFSFFCDQPMVPFMGNQFLSCMPVIFNSSTVQG